MCKHRNTQTCKRWRARCFSLSLSCTHTHLSLSLYIYIYICVCVCCYIVVLLQILLNKSLSLDLGNNEKYFHIISFSKLETNPRFCKATLSLYWILLAVLAPVSLKGRWNVIFVQSMKEMFLLASNTQFFTSMNITTS